MNNVERFNKTLNFEKTDRLPRIEWATWWDVTIDRWKDEGLVLESNDITFISEYLGLDSIRQYWLRPRSVNCPCEASHGAALLSTDDEYEKFKKKEYLFPEDPFDKNDLKNWSTKMAQGETVIWFTFEGFFWFPRSLLGIEQHLFAFYDNPKLMHEMNQDLVDYYLQQLRKFTDVCIPLFMTFAEDMSYNHGPMLSEKQFDEFIAPYYLQIVPELKKLGIKVLVDSDGDVNPLIPWLKKVGIEGILPLERMAGIDVAQIREYHPDFLVIGGFDKTVLCRGQAAIEAEFDRLMPVMSKGGFIPSVDHQTPPEVSLKNYRMYLKLLEHASSHCNAI
jgi:hypothetical protein